MVLAFILQLVILKAESQFLEIFEISYGYNIIFLTSIFFMFATSVTISKWLMIYQWFFFRFECRNTKTMTEPCRNEFRLIIFDTIFGVIAKVLCYDR